METKYLNLSATTKAFWDQYNLSKKEGILLLKSNCVNTSFLTSMDELKIVLDYSFDITKESEEFDKLNKIRIERYQKHIQPEIEAKVAKWKDKLTKKYTAKINPVHIEQAIIEEK